MPATNDVDFADLDTLLQLIRDGAPAKLVRTVEVEADKVRVPGVWVRFDGLTPGSLAGVDLNLTVHLIAPEGPWRRALGVLGDLFNAVRPVLEDLGGPTGPVRTAGVVLPGSSTPLPALAVPFDLHTTQE